MVLIEILLKESTSSLFLKLVTSVLPRHMCTYHPNVVTMIDVTLLHVLECLFIAITSIDKSFGTIYVYPRYSEMSEGILQKSVSSICTRTLFNYNLLNYYNFFSLIKNIYDNRHNDSEWTKNWTKNWLPFLIYELFSKPNL